MGNRIFKSTISEPSESSFSGASSLRIFALFKSLTFLLIVFTLLLSSHISQAEETPDHQTINALIDRAEILLEEDRSDSAAILAREAAGAAQQEIGVDNLTYVRAIHILGRCKSLQADFTAADSLLHEALEISERIPGRDEREYAGLLYDLGVLYEDQGKYDRALETGMRVLDLRRRLLGPGHRDVASCYNLIGSIRKNLGRFDEAESSYRMALEIFTKKLGPDHLEVARTLNNLGILSKERGNYDEAISYIEQALEIKKKQPDPRNQDMAKSLMSLGIIFKKKGLFAEAEMYYKEALSIYEQFLGPDHIRVAECLNNLAVLYAGEWKFNEAEHMYKQALEIKEKTYGSDHPSVARTLANLAIVYFYEGRYDEAEIYLKRGIEISEKTLGPDHPDVAGLYSRLANLYLKQARYREAEPLEKKALIIRERALAPDHPALAESMNNLAVAYGHQDKFEQAEPLLLKAIAIKEKRLGPDHPTTASSISALGVVYFHMGRYDDAEPLLVRALDVREKTLGPDHPRVALSLLNLAKNQCARGMFTESLATYRKLQRARQNYIEEVFSYASEDQKMKYIRGYPLLDHSFLSFTDEQRSDESVRACFDMVLKGKAAILDAISAERSAAYCSYDEDIITNMEEHAEICSKISELFLSEKSHFKGKSYTDSLQSLYEIKDSLEVILSGSCSEFERERAALKYGFDDVTEALPDGSVLCEIIKFNPYRFTGTGGETSRTAPARYLVFILEKSGQCSLIDLGRAAPIDSLVRTARGVLSEAVSSIYGGDEMGAERKLSKITGRLYDIVFSPIEKHVPEGGHVFISPDGKLNLLPFEILTGPDGKYLIENYAVSYLSSGRDLLRDTAPAEESTAGAIVIADPDFDTQSIDVVRGEVTIPPSTYYRSPSIPLRSPPDRTGCLRTPFDQIPSSHLEGKIIASLLLEKGGIETKFYHGPRASESVLKNISSPPRILHLATHGYFCGKSRFTVGKELDENPLLYSGMAFAGANHLIRNDETVDTGTMNGEDGILTSLEVSGLNLFGTELVVLSACETGIGEIELGEGVYGLRRSFHHAGVRTLVMSMWDIPDSETVEFMRGFYEHWLSGESRSDALRNTALTILSERRAEKGCAHPLFWGGFVLVGDPQ